MKILLHICCGPCSIFPIAQLREMGHQLEGFFFNPNIHPFKEFERRLDTLKEYAAAVALPLTVDGRYLLEDFLKEAMRSDRIRCESCYEMRFRIAAAMAKQLSCDAFTSTLLVSPYQKHDLIHEVGERVAGETGMPFYYVDFRPGWHLGVQISRERQMYRQPYCGCIFSEKERYCKSK
ncbi:MAG: epoxyqueuosine reductase QueH [Veillonellaceae bacterium]|jgi:hypothetical protein|nr:epoxyqueuosine reductase QueH [Veillonellaceae bacterium]